MAYGRKSGYGSYGPKNVGLGGRVIEMKEVQINGNNTFEFQTWVIDENGKKVNQDYKYSGYMVSLL